MSNEQLAPEDRVFVYLNKYEIHDLATYNSEVARGLVHTDEWKRRMASLQERFNAEQARRARVFR